MKYDVFISYSRKDMAVADKVVEAFDAAGISYFIDRQEMSGGLESSKVLATAIKDSTVFLFLASKNSYESKYTRNEVVYAFNKKENPQIIPYIIDGSTLPDELELTLSSFKCRNMRNHSIQTVVEDVLKKIGRESNSPIDLAIDTKPVADTQPNSRRRKLWPWLAVVCAVLAVALVVILAMRGCGGAKSTEGNGEQTALSDTAAQAGLELTATEDAPTPVEEAKSETTLGVAENSSNPVPAGYVDLGLSVYWAKSNRLNPDDDHGFYTYDQAKKKYGDRLPTKAQWEELKDKCKWTWMGSGYKVTGPNGNSIVLPAAGHRHCGGDVYFVRTNGFYWSSTPNVSDYAWYLNFYTLEVSMRNYYRCGGLSVRLVQGK